MKETDSFENLHEFVDTNDYDATSVIIDIKHIFHHWWDSFSSAGDAQFIDMTSETEFHITDSECGETVYTLWDREHYRK